jgi:hypothetical protein
MTESQQPVQFPEADGGGGRSGRGPATHVPGETEPGGVLPPYDGRKESGEIDGEGKSGPKTVQGLTSPVPSETPGGATASPADEQPAQDTETTVESDPGVGPAHMPGTPRGEGFTSESAESDPDQSGSEHDGHGDTSADRPSGVSKPEDWTGISPSEPATDTPFEGGGALASQS